MSIIEVNHVTKEYRLGHMKSLKQSVLGAFSRLRGNPSAKQKPFKALDDVDFKVEEGEVLGIIGTNGAGKSTLLKLLARVSTPTEGDIKVRGSVAPLIEVGAGLHPELTGRENIYLNGSIMGLPRAVIKEKFDEIVEFAELEQFIDTPIKRYSSGMMIRLGFAIATTVDADILIIDEVLAVGDLAFQRKCFDRMEDMIKQHGKTVLLVSHNIRQVERICNRVFLLDQGKILADGKPGNICNLFYERSDEKIKTHSKASGRARDHSSGEMELVSVTLLDQNGIPIDTIEHNADVTVSLSFRARVELVKPAFGVGIHTTDFLFLANDESIEKLGPVTIAPGTFRVQCHIRKFPLLPGVYSLRVGVAIGELCSAAFYAENLFHFRVQAKEINRTRAMHQGFIPLDTNWEISEVASAMDDNRSSPEKK
ncbi:MAG: polysaccharide/polyol phosphate ABC transporter ATP-binding protein [Desulfobacterales bacterium PC51MH44]|nr:MAG: polysaccharide/polyol phosphate ABC transporter ATP-binding protein [Desulfobacterales bacterium PC51MH44]